MRGERDVEPRQTTPRERYQKGDDPAHNQGIDRPGERAADRLQRDHAAYLQVFRDARTRSDPTVSLQDGQPETAKNTTKRPGTPPHGPLEYRHATAIIEGETYLHPGDAGAVMVAWGASVLDASRKLNVAVKAARIRTYRVGASRLYHEADLIAEAERLAPW